MGRDAPRAAAARAAPAHPRRAPGSGRIVVPVDRRRRRRAAADRTSDWRHALANGRGQWVGRCGQPISLCPVENGASTYANLIGALHGGTAYSRAILLLSTYYK